jgi:uncharacterized membrane protein
MKVGEKISNLIQKGSLGLLAMLLSRSVFAVDLLNQALEGDAKDTLGSGAMFWKIFILVDIVLATAMAVKSKNPMVFLGVFFIAFIPGLLLKLFVFKV